MKMLSVLFYQCVGIECSVVIESGPKVERLKVIQKVHGVCSVTCILTIFLSMTLFCKLKEFNSEIIFVPISKYDFGYYVVSDIKCHFWLNAYFVKELHLICKCLWACPKLKSLPQRFENENAYINEVF